MLWVTSVLFILLSFLLFDRVNYFTLAASLIGATSLIFSAKGHPFGQFLMIVFSIMYRVISFHNHYYGELMTYVFMTAPMALFSLITWLNHPFEGNSAQVEVNHLQKNEIVKILIFTTVVTFVFLLYLTLLPYGLFTNQYSFSDDKFLSSCFNGEAFGVLCSGLCRQRCGPDRFMGFSMFIRSFLPVCCRLLYHILSE